MSEPAAIGVEDLGLDASRKRLEAGALLVDVRNKDEWDAGHAPQAYFLPLPQLQTNTSGAIAEIRRRLERDTDKEADPEVIVVCRSGKRSQKAAEILVANGVRASNLAGGMKAWAEAGMAMRSETGSDPKVI